MVAGSDLNRGVATEPAKAELRRLVAPSAALRARQIESAVSGSRRHTSRESGVGAAQPPPRRHRPPILVRCGEFDREIAEGPSLTREERAVLLLLFQENGGRATATLHPARDQTHLAGATTASPATEDNLRSGLQDCAQDSLLATTHDGIPDRAQSDRVQSPSRGPPPLLLSSAVTTYV